MKKHEVITVSDIKGNWNDQIATNSKGYYSKEFSRLNYFINKGYIVIDKVIFQLGYKQSITFILEKNES